MNSQKKPNFAEAPISAPAPSTKRRQLLKGAMLTVPAIMTLRNGAAWAGTSHRCAIGTKTVAVIDPATGQPKLNADGNPVTEEQVLYSTPCLASLGLGNNATP